MLLKWAVLGKCLAHFDTGLTPDYYEETLLPEDVTHRILVFGKLCRNYAPKNLTKKTGSWVQDPS